MSDAKNKDATPENEAEEAIRRQQDLEPEAQAEDQPADAADPAEEKPAAADPLAALKAENAELKDRLMRALAEVENVRRRGERDRQDMAKFGAQSLAKELLPVVDNLRRAIDAVPEEQRAENEATANLLTGIEMTEKMLLDAFEKNAIKKIDPLDEKFSYERHQAISEAPGTGKPSGTVVQVLQPGYMLHDRLLRPAMVVVAKGDAAPPKDDHEGIDTTA